MSKKPHQAREAEPKEAPAPTVGRIVHLFRRSENVGTGPHAAIVTRVHGDGTVDLHVMPPTQSAHSAHAISYGGDVPNDVIDAVWWTWPPREGAEAKPSEGGDAP